MSVLQSADDELRMNNMQVDLERAEVELREKTAELVKLREELDALQRDNEVRMKNPLVLNIVYV